MTASRMIHPRRRPVSSRYEFVMPPFLSFSNTKWLRTSAGNRTNHTIGDKCCVTLFHIPPVPSSDAYVKPIYLGSPGLSSYTLVGCW